MSEREYYDSDERPPEFFLLDANVISEVMAKQPNPHVMKWLDVWDISQTFISVMTIGEIRKGIDRKERSKRRTELETWFNRDLKKAYNGRILAIDTKIADCWGELMAEYKHHHNPVDMMIAATAITHDMTLVTRNEKHFNIRGLRVMNPWLE